MFVYILNDFKLDELYTFCMISDAAAGPAAEPSDGDDPTQHVQHVH